MRADLTTQEGTHPVDRAAIQAQMASGQFFWLDLDGTDDEALDVLGSVFGLHNLALRDAEHFGQRPKLDDYETFAYLVVHGGPENPDPTSPAATGEVHFICAEQYLVSIHRGPCRALVKARERMAHHTPGTVGTPQLAILYVVIDQLVDSFFPSLDAFDNRIDELEDAVLVRPTEDQLGTLFSMKRRLIGLRKVLTPQRDLFASVSSGVVDLPGLDDHSRRYLRDIYDHLIRLGDLLDGYRDLLSGVMDTHLSTVSNRLNVVMKQLTVIATIFLPLTFLTGFFGQNFGVLVRHIMGPWAFWGLGVGLEGLSVVGLLVVFWKRGWMSGSGV
jgi:magnesium transporter